MRFLGGAERHHRKLRGSKGRPSHELGEEDLAVKADLADAAAVSNVIAQGPWSEAEKEQLAAAVALAAQQKDPQKIAGARRPLQRMSAFAAYLTQTQLNFLSSDRAAAEKVHYAADVMVRMGLVMPSEPTSGHVVATIRELGAAELADGNHFRRS